MAEVRFQIPGRVALVTGGGSGIGRAIAFGLGGAGLSVAILEKEPERVEKAEADLKAGDIRGCAIKADVSKSADIEEAVAKASKTLGEIDILVNCAGIFPRSPVAEMSEEEWDRTLGTNLRSVFLASRAVLKPMIARRRGHILSITSGLGITGAPRGSHYAASKGGMNGFIRSLAREVGSAGINVNAIAPGLTDTPMMRGANSPEYIASVTSNTPGNRLGEPQDVVGLAMFLVSEGARYITGQVIALRG